MGGETRVVYGLPERGDDTSVVAPNVWREDAPVFTNACEEVVWYKVTNPNYEDFVHAAKVTVAPRDIAHATVAALADQPFTGSAIRPAVAVADGEPSLITGDDYDIAYSDNINAGTATVTLTGKRNYTGARTVPFTITPATIHYVADGSAGEYCGEGYGITVNVSTPAGGVTVEYATAAEGPWSATPVAYTNACAERPVFFSISAPNHTTVVDSAKVTITPKELTEDYVWGVYPAEAYVYDGTAKEPGAACGDGEPSIITEDDFEVTYEDNVAAGTARIVFTGRNNYAGVVEEEFEIEKAENAWTTEPSVADWTYGQSPAEPVGAAKHGTATVTYSTGARPTLPGSYTATFTVPESANYLELTKTVGFRILPATIHYVADGSAGEYCGEGYGITVSVSTPSTGVTVEYATAAEGPWSATPVAYTNVCAERPVFFRIAATGYETVTGSANVTITPKALTEDVVWGVYPAEEYVYDGTAKEPGAACGDGEPSIITEDDFEVAYEDNVAAGTARIVFTGRNNYAGVVEEEFEILPAELTADGGEPGAGEVPAGGLSKFDAAAVYDGEGHTIDVDALVAAFAAAGDVRITYARAVDGEPTDGWSEEAPVFTNACEEVVWYRASKPNYEDFVHAAKVTIAKRDATLASGSGSWVYDGAAHSNATVTASGFVDGEGVTADGFATITGVGTVANTFDYAFNEGTLAANYAVTVETGTLEVTRSVLDPGAVLGGSATAESPLVCELVYNGAAQGLPLEPDLGGEPYDLLYALASDGAYSETSPTRTNVADGDLRIHFKVVSPNYEPLCGVAVLRIVPKAVTEEMLDYGDDVFFFDGADTKVPDVVLADTNAVGAVISTADDYTRVYGERLATGEYPVTITGRNNYTGSATKAFAVLKRPISPPVIGSQAYNGRTRRATVPSDPRWTVVRNDGGVEAGDYPVTLRLTNTEDYRWTGQGEDEAEWTGVFTIRRAANGWSTTPGMKGWAYGEAPSEPVARARYGTFSVAYRRKGADVASETAERPSIPGDYIARFWVEESANYAAVASAEVAFTIARGSYTGGDHTTTTPEPVPYSWLDPYLAAYGGGDYERAGHATGRNGVALWASYVAGLDPEDPESRLLADIRMDAAGEPVVTWSPDLSKNAVIDVLRVYTVYGKARLDDPAWTPVTDGNRAQMRFFKVGVRLAR